MTVELAPSGDGIVLRLTHERVPADQMEPHGRGWTSILDHLAAVLAPEVRRKDRR